LAAAISIAVDKLFYCAEAAVRLSTLMRFHRTVEKVRIAPARTGASKKAMSYPRGNIGMPENRKVWAVYRDLIVTAKSEPKTKMR